MRLGYYTCHTEVSVNDYKGMKVEEEKLHVYVRKNKIWEMREVDCGVWERKVNE